MRLCAGLALSVAGFLAVAPAARADSLCVASGLLPDCTESFGSFQEALDAASARPGHDEIALPVGRYSSPTGFRYSDGGDPGNALTVFGEVQCQKYGCEYTDITDGPAGGVLLDIATTGAAVELQQLRLRPAAEATGLVLPGGATASGVSIDGSRDAAGVRLGGTPGRQAVFRGSVQSWAGTEPAVDVTGHALLLHAGVTAGLGIRVRGAGMADVRGGFISAHTALSGTRARVVGTWVSSLPDYHSLYGTPMVAFEARCPDAAAPDAELELRSVTVGRRDHPDVTGVRAVASGGDGHACDAVVRMRNTLLHELTVPLDARGDAGEGAAPEDGHARIEAAYSAFDADAVSTTGPAEIVDAGGNLDPAPGTALRNGSIFFGSVLIDSGDPAPLEAWEQSTVSVVNGRRDIGVDEYLFATPKVQALVWPAAVVTPGTTVEFLAHGNDEDRADVLIPRWVLSDGTTSSADKVSRTYGRRGIFRESLTMTDPSGRSGTDEQVVRVVRQRLSGLAVQPSRVRAVRPGGPTRGRLTFRLAAYADSVRFRFTRLRRGRRARPVRVSSPVSRFVLHGRRRVPLSSILGFTRALAPGRYQVAVVTRGAPPLRARFRVLR